MRSRRTVGQSEPCSPRRLKQQATSNAASRNIGKISGVLGIRLVGWHPWVQPAGQPPPPEPPAIGNAPASASLGQLPEGEATRAPRPLLGSRSPPALPGGTSHHGLSWPVAGRRPFPLSWAGHSELQRWAVPACVCSPAGMLLVWWVSLHSSPFTAPCWPPGSWALGEKSRDDQLQLKNIESGCSDPRDPHCRHRLKAGPTGVCSSPCNPGGFWISQGMAFLQHLWVTWSNVW